MAIWFWSKCLGSWAVTSFGWIPGTCQKMLETLCWFGDILMVCTFVATSFITCQRYYKVMKKNKNFTRLVQEIKMMSRLRCEYMAKTALHTEFEVTQYLIAKYTQCNKYTTSFLTQFRNTEGKENANECFQQFPFSLVLLVVLFCFVSQKIVSRCKQRVIPIQLLFHELFYGM